MIFGEEAARREPGEGAYRGVLALLVLWLAILALQWLVAAGALR